ncbi:MAG TPA: helical backbone metal receptor [Daejeonella sp.]|nr:helical backbone metal receptor [Daejeonella sp.]
MQKRTFIDQLNRQVSVCWPPRRIISLVPSQTELLFELGLDEEVIGVTKFCIHPQEKFKTKTKIGGTKKLDMDLIRRLQPDLIIGNKEENEQQQIEQLMQEFPVWMSDIHHLTDALKMIDQLGVLVGKEQTALDLVNQIEKGFVDLSAIQNFEKPLRVVYLIWKNPYMVAAKNTFIDDVIQKAGWKNAFDSKRYPELSAADIQASEPDLILLSSEPYPFKEKHIEEFESICPKAKVMVVDGEMFSWYGSRLLFTPGYLKTLTRTK